MGGRASLGPPTVSHVLAIWRPHTVPNQCAPQACRPHCESARSCPSYVLLLPLPPGVQPKLLPSDRGRISAAQIAKAINMVSHSGTQHTYHVWYVVPLHGFVFSRINMSYDEGEGTSTWQCGGRGCIKVAIVCRSQRHPRQRRATALPLAAAAQLAWAGARRTARPWHVARGHDTCDAPYGPRLALQGHAQAYALAQALRSTHGTRFPAV